jgi:hypothetical protein
MGGRGSGTWYRHDKKMTLDNALCLDIRTLKRFGALSPGYRHLSWSSRGRENASIGLYVAADRLVLDYRYSPSGREPKSVQETVMFDFTACHYGGKRPWFQCPCCQGRVAVLYGYRGRFLCRHCHRLPYGCQQETDLDRMYRKTRKIRRRLEGSMNLFDPILPWQKPQGMHWSTFKRLMDQELQAYVAVCQEMITRTR